MKRAGPLTVLRILEVRSSGLANKSCPHCSATGKTVIWFVASDGKVHGAMRGCFTRAFYSSSESKELAKLEGLLAKYPGWQKVERQIEMLSQKIERIYGVDVFEPREVPVR